MHLVVWLPVRSIDSTLRILCAQWLNLSLSNCLVLASTGLIACLWVVATLLGYSLDFEESGVASDFDAV